MWNDWGVDSMGSAETCTEHRGLEINAYMKEKLYQQRCADQDHGYDKCWEMEGECSWDEVFEKFGGNVTIG